MAYLDPVITYDKKLIQPGVDLAVTADVSSDKKTATVTGAYGDYGSWNDTYGTGVKATCSLSIHYSNVEWYYDDDATLHLSGDISNDQLVRVFKKNSSNHQHIKAWFNNVLTKEMTIGTSEAGTWDLQITESLSPEGHFEVTIPASMNPQPATPVAIHFYNINAEKEAAGGGTKYPPDEFYMGLIVTNPNPPIYRPGEVLDDSSVWQSHNRTNGQANIMLPSFSWRTMTTQGGGVSDDDPPKIYYQQGTIMEPSFYTRNMRKIGEGK